MGLTEKYNTVFEKVEVITHSANGKINVHRIKWNNTVYKVIKLNREWLTRDGDNPAMNYSVVTDQDITFQLRYDKLAMTWELVKWDSIH